VAGVEPEHALKAAFGLREIPQVPESVAKSDQRRLVVRIESETALEGAARFGNLDEMQMIIAAFDRSDCVRRIDVRGPGKRGKRSDAVIVFPELPALLDQEASRFGGRGGRRGPPRSARWAKS